MDELMAEEAEVSEGKAGKRMKRVVDLEHEVD